MNNNTNLLVISELDINKFNIDKLLFSINSDYLKEAKQSSEILKEDCKVTKGSLDKLFDI